MALSRRLSGIVPVVALLLVPAASLSAQVQQGSPPDRIDLLAGRERDDAPLEDCSEEQEAAAISGEIVVCRRKADTAAYGFDKEEWESRYARETMNKNDPRTPDPCGPNCGIFKGEPTIGKLCIPGLQKCPPPPAYFIDFSTLPAAPPGSDADRIARGLPPLGRDGAQSPVVPATNNAQLGLPPPPDRSEDVSPSGSASPAEEPSG